MDKDEWKNLGLSNVDPCASAAKDDLHNVVSKPSTPT